MGLFSSKTEIDVFSNALTLGDPDSNLVGQTVVHTLLGGNDIVPAVIGLALYGVSSHVDSMMRYAKDGYTLGLPSGANSITAILDDTDVERAITEDLNLPYGCAVDFNYVTPLNVFHTIIPFLEKQRGYNVVTNVIKIFPSTIIYPTPPTPTYNEFLTGTSHKLIVAGVELSTDLLTVTITYQLSTTYKFSSYKGYATTNHYNTVTTSQSEDISTVVGMAGYRIGCSYCIAKYYVYDSLGAPSTKANWWFYDTSSGKYPLLSRGAIVDDSNNLFPVIPIRYNNQSYTDTAHQETALYKTSKKLLKKISIDIDYLSEKVEENPGIADIDHAYVMFGVNLQTERVESIRYLAEFFDYLADTAIINQSTLTNSLIAGTSVRQATYDFNYATLPVDNSTTTITKTDDEGEEYNVTVTNPVTPISLVEHGLDSSVTYTSIESHVVNGSIGKLNHATMTMSAGTDVGYFRSFGSGSDSVLIIKLQISASAYKQVTVRGLTHTNRIYRGHGVVTTLADVISDPENHNFIIPLHYGVCKDIPLWRRNQLYLEAIHIVFLGFVKTKVKWYEQTIFKFILGLVFIIIGVILSAFGQGWIGGPMIEMGIAMIAGAILVEILPPDILEAIKIIYIIYQIYTLDWAGIVQGTATAAQCLAAVTMAITVAQIPIDIRMRNLQGEAEDLAVEHEAQEKELEEVQALLDVSSMLDAGLLLDNIRYQPLLMDAPSSFYNLKLLANPGILTLHHTRLYFLDALSLPDNSFIAKPEGI